MREIASLVALSLSCGSSGKKAPKIVSEVESGCPDLIVEAPTTVPRLQIQEQHQAGIAGLSYSSNGALLASASYDGTVRVWSTGTGSLLRVVRGSEIGTPNDIAWHQNGRSLAIAAGRSSVIYDIETGVRIRFRHPVLDYSPIDEIALAKGHEQFTWLGLQADAIRRFSASGEPVGELKNPAGVSVTSDTSGLTVSADGQTAVVASRRQGLVVWDLAAPDRPGRLLPIEGLVDTAAVTPDGAGAVAWVRTLTAEIRGRMVLVNLATGAVETVGVPKTWAGDIELATDGTRAALLTGDAVGYDVTERKMTWTRRGPDRDIRGTWGVGRRYQSAVAMSPTGRETAIATSGGSIELVDRTDGRLRKTLGFAVRRPHEVTFGSRTQLLVRAEQDLMIWSLQSGRIETQVQTEGTIAAQALPDGSMRLLSKVPRWSPGCKGHWVRRGSSQLSGLEKVDEWSPKLCLENVTRVADTELRAGLALTSVVEKREGTQWIGLAIDDLTTGARTRLQGSEKHSSGGRFSADGLHVIGNGISLLGVGVSNIPIWEVATGKQLLSLSISHPVYDLTSAWYAALGNGQAAVTAGSQLSVRSFPDNRTLAEHQFDGQVSALDYVPGSSILLVGTVGGGLYRIDKTEIEARATSSGGPIRQLIASPTNDRLATASDDGAIRIWKLSTLQLLSTLVSFQDDEFVAITPNGNYAGTTEVSDRVGWVFGRPLEHFTFEQFTRYRDSGAVKKHLVGAETKPESAVRRPPRVEVLAAPTKPVSGRRIQITARAASEGRVDTVRAYVEGVARAESKLCRKTGEVRLELPLFAGTNTVTVVAFDDLGASSNPAAVAVEAVARQARRPRLWTVAVGVSAYPNLPKRYQLSYADDDARDIAAALRQRAGPDRFYRDVNASVLIDRQATAKSVLAALERLSAMDRDDVAVVYLAGHGIKVNDDAEMVFLTRNASLNPASLDAFAIDWGEIATRLQAAKGRVILLLDACHSGHVTRRETVRNQELAAELVRARRSGVIVFSAAKGRQQSLEPNGSRSLRVGRLRPAGSSTDDQNGLFASSILASLDDVSTDRNVDGSIQLSELIEDVTRRVSWASAGLQTPWVARRELFGDFAVASTNGQ